MPRPLLLLTAAALAAVSWCVTPAAQAAEPVETTTTAAPTADVVTPDPQVPTPADPRVLVFGDSISASWRYNATGANGKSKAWWAWIAEAAGLDPKKVMVSAEAGSGLLSRGMGTTQRICTGTVFGDRLDEVAVTDPDVVLVEVGRNDVWNCAGRSRVAASAAERRKAANAYFATLGRAVDRQGVRRSNVYVMTAWGSGGGSNHVAVTTGYEVSAKAHGFSWIPLPSLTRERTFDGVHPNAAGSRTLATWALRSSDVAAAIASRGTSHGAVPSGASVRCRGLKACRAAGRSVHGYGKVRNRIWGASAPSARNYVAHRLTTSGRAVAPILTSTTAAGWRRETISSGAAMQTSQPQVGDVAWWLDAPAGIGGTSGHVAVVDKVAADRSWVLVTEVTATGVFRTTRYSGSTFPRAFLRFKATNGSPVGKVSAISAKRKAITVSGRAVDTDRPRAGTRIQVVVTQGKGRFTVTAHGATRYAFSHRFTLPKRLHRGKATVKVIALDAPGSRGHAKQIAKRTVTIG